MIGRFAFALTACLAVLSPVSAQGVIADSTRAKLQARAGHYPLRDVTLFGGDSALLVFDDSMYSGQARRSGRWMFGPAVSAAEADGCPPEKVLGRKLARILWRDLGRPSSMTRIMVKVGGTTRIAAGEYSKFYYHRRELTEPWAGDRSR